MLRDSRLRPCVTLREAARRLGVSAVWVWKLTRTGRLPSERRGPYRLIPIWALERCRPDPVRQARLRKLARLSAVARRP